MDKLSRAARAGDDARVKDLLREGAEVNARDSIGRTALHYACASEHKDKQRVVDVLLEAGADVNVQDVCGQTPLHVAVNRMRTKISSWISKFQDERTKILFYENVRMKALDIRMGTGLHRTLGTRSRDTLRVLVDALLEAGAQTNIRDEQGQTALHVAINNHRIDLVKALLATNTSESSKERTSQHLVDHSEDGEEVCMVNLRDRHGDTALHMVINVAISVENIKECVYLLLWAGATVGVKNDEGMTALHVAVRKSRQIIDFLLNIGEDVNATDKYGDTALHMASEKGETETVRLLLRKGAKVGVKNEEGMTALHLAVRKRRQIIDFLLNIGEDVNATDKYGDTALHMASEKGETETVRLLLRKGAKVGVKNAMGMTPLHKAVAFAAGDTVDVLVDLGENVSAKDVHFNTPLHHLGVTGVMNLSQLRKSKALAFIINLLIIRGAKIDEQNIYGEKPYDHLAMRDEVGRLGMKIVEETLITQVIRLKTLGLQDKFDISWILGPYFYNNTKNRCCQELENMKSTMVVKYISLYQVLSHINHSFLLSTGDLQQIDKFLSSPDLLKRFPLYGETLRITFQRAKLLTLAVQSFYSETREQMLKKLPLSVGEQLLNLLSNKDLRTFIESE